MSASVDETESLATTLGRVLLPHTDTPGVLVSFDGEAERFVRSPAYDPTVLAVPPRRAAPPLGAAVFALRTFDSSAEYPSSRTSPGAAEVVESLAALRSARVSSIGPGLEPNSVLVGFESLERRSSVAVAETLEEMFGELVTVYEAGRAESQAGGPPFGHVSPLRPGCSVSSIHSTFGTVGAIVECGRWNGILSNAHVLHHPKSVEVLHPGKGESGAKPSHVGERHADLLPSRASLNSCDAALARLDDQVSVDPRLLVSGHPYGTVIDDVPQGTQVAKVGASSGLTYGTVTQTRARVACWYGRTLMTFVDQFEILGDDGRPFSSPGDSGSVVWTVDDQRPFGLLFGGNFERSWASRLSGPLASFGIHIL